MVPSDSILGKEDGRPGHLPVRVRSSIEKIPDFTLRIQCEVLQVLGLLDNWKSSSEFLTEFGEALRKIIDTYEKVSGKRPTVHDIIWCLGCDLRINPREKAKKWASAA